MCRKNRGLIFPLSTTRSNTLRDPKTRLRHWLELEFPAGLERNQQVPAAIAELFMQMSGKRRALDAFLAKQSRASAPLARALLASEKFALLDDLEKWLAILNEKQSLLLRELESLDARNKERVAEIYQHLSYLSKWSGQIREGVVKLGM